MDNFSELANELMELQHRREDQVTLLWEVGGMISVLSVGDYGETNIELYGFDFSTVAEKVRQYIATMSDANAPEGNA